MKRVRSLRVITGGERTREKRFPLFLPYQCSLWGISLSSVAKTVKNYLKLPATAWREIAYQF
jgi:hypothetical protein